MYLFDKIFDCFKYTSMYIIYENFIISYNEDIIVASFKQILASIVKQ